MLAVVGPGYVGRPLAVEVAWAGLKVIGLDVSAAKVAALNRGESYIPDVPSSLLRAVVAIVLPPVKPVGTVAAARHSVCQWARPGCAR